MYVCMYVYLKTLLHCAACKFRSRVVSAGPGRIFGYVTFLPSALERRVSGRTGLWTLGACCSNGSAAGKAVFFFPSLELTLLHRQKKSIPIRFFLGHCGTISMAPVARG